MKGRKNILLIRLSNSSILVVAVLLLVGIPTAAGMATYHRASPRNGSAAPSTLRITDQVFANSYFVDSVARIGHTALCSVELTNFTFELVLVNLSSNTTRVLSGSAGAVSGNIPSTSIAVGDHQFLEIYRNSSTGVSTFQSVNLSGAVRTLGASFPAGPFWRLLAANTSRAWLVGNNFTGVASSFLELNSRSLNVVHNYTSSIPRGASLSAVLTENTSVYMAGSRPAAHGATTVAYFGILNLATGTIASRMVPPHNAPANVSGSFTSLIDQGGQVYVGGIYQAHVNVSWFANYLGGYLYRYSPSTGRFLNDSSVLPSGGINGAGVIQLEPWGKNIAIVDYANFINFTYFAQSTYTYVLSHHGNVLTNVTALLPSQFFSASNLLTEPRGGPYIAAGWDNSNGDGEMVSVRV